MDVRIIEERLKEYAPTSGRDELNAIKEIVQEIALCALARADFFKIAAFQGGSCLRIVHKLNRFSEDLDFILRKPDNSFVLEPSAWEPFAWEPFLKVLQSEFRMYSFDFQIIDRSKADKAVKMAFLKDNSFGKILVLTHPRGPSDKQTIQIKLEIDTNPPEGSGFQTHFLDFPYAYSITVQDLPSLFASKLHAILCRPYVKGRDWFDFVWYVSKKIVPNYTHLQNAINQTGPWENQNIHVATEWLISELKNKISKIDWQEAKKDIENFLRVHERQALAVWGYDFFIAMVEKLSESLQNKT